MYSSLEPLDLLSRLASLVPRPRVNLTRYFGVFAPNAKAKMFSYVRMWLQTGLSNPRVSSMTERMMREIGRRIKKIGFNWSPEGTAKVTRIIIKRITSANEWEQHWKKKLNFKGTVKLSFEGCVPV